MNFISSPDLRGGWRWHPPPEPHERGFFCHASTSHRLVACLTQQAYNALEPALPPWGPGGEKRECSAVVGLLVIGGD